MSHDRLFCVSMTWYQMKYIVALIWLIGYFFTNPVTAATVQVKTAVFVVDLRDIDGARQAFAADIFVRLRWKDPKLAGGEGAHNVPLTSAWNPNLQIVNRLAVQSTLPEVLEVDPEGNVTYRQRYIGQFSCNLDLREFPFDRQTIPIRLVAIGFAPTDVQFVRDSEGGVVGKPSITDWKLLSWNAQEQQYSVPGGRSLAGYEFNFQAKRYVQYFIVQIILPLTLVLGMSWIVFWLDHAQPGPRISISITAMLTVVAHRLLINNFLPRLPYLTRMDYFVFSCTLLVFLSLVAVVYITRLGLKQDDSSATKVNSASRWIFPALFAIVLLGSFVL